MDFATVSVRLRVKLRVDARCSLYNKTLWTHEDERTVLYKTKSLDGTKPNTHPKTNPNPNSNTNPI